ncbi:phospholipase DDHD1-like isoform X1 [Neocloeon triangulifer]|uniref:phospholipase DDHD1-like isoform X1 n=1 Tax=Neocloeon triangulifer TaxID=2078957 RepID=UPI00286F24A1|nr:phospholipase DDHD1-like isoform X1 [Neocloeon triangulifer]
MNFPTPGDSGDLGYSLNGDSLNGSVVSTTEFILEEQVHQMSLEQDSACAFDYHHEQQQFPVEDYEYWNEDSVISELTAGEVRWFYKSDTDKRWTEFNGYDSHQIEFLYRQYNQEWLQVYTEQQGNGGEGVGVKIPKHQIVVRGGMYEVDVHSWKGYSIFWPGEEFLVTRGTWFFAATWQPVEYPHCDTIEHSHLQLFCGQRLSDYADTSLSQKEVWHTEQLPDFHVDWHSPKDVFLHNETAPSKLMRSVTQKLGFQKPTGYRLIRGYKTPALATDSADRITDITHLVFVIHGIGQKMDIGRIIRNSNSFRDCVTWLQKKYFPDSSDRPEFFPVEWRTALKLDGDLVSAITPLNLEKLRSLLNATAMDIMYYTSPLFGQEIQAGLCLELNRLYSMFLERYPNFKENGGKCSVIAHSLGCVIVYDIVTGWLPNDPMACLQKANSSEGREEMFKKSGLLFEIENLFCLGSPLSVFLALRWKDPHEPENHDKVVPPKLCKRLYNVFHATDPVAYRLEPLLVRAYKTIAPLTLQPYNASAKIPYDQMPLEPIQTENLLSRKSALGGGGDASDRDEMTPEPISSSIPSPPTPSRVADRWSLWSLMRGGRRSVQAEGSHEPISKEGSGSPTHHHENALRGLEHRLDFVLRENQLAASYFAALTSHTAYWENYDVAFFILTRLFPKLEQEAQVPTTVEGSPSIQKNSRLV